MTNNQYNPRHLPNGYVVFCSLHYVSPKIKFSHKIMTFHFPWLARTLSFSIPKTILLSRKLLDDRDIFSPLLVLLMLKPFLLPIVWSVNVCQGVLFHYVICHFLSLKIAVSISFFWVSCDHCWFYNDLIGHQVNIYLFICTRINMKWLFCNFILVIVCFCILKVFVYFF